MSLFDRVESIDRGVEVITDWLGDGGIPVDRELAQARADICLNCPSNTAGNRLIECVATAVRRHVEVKNKLGLRVSGEKSLHECGICLCSLKLKIWVPIGLIRRHMMEGEMDKFPDYCWQKIEQP